jgi:hypothetical protein
MDKKLIAAFTFGLLAVSAANLLLSVGILSLLLTGSPGTDVQLADTGNSPWAGMETRNAVSLTGLNNSTMSTNVSKADMSALSVTVTPAPSMAQQTSAGSTASGQFTPPSGQLPPAGQFPQGAGGPMPSSGQLPSSAGQTAATGQIPAGTGQAMPSAQASSGASPVPSAGPLPSGTGSLPVNGMPSARGTGALSSDLTSLINGQTGTVSQATATPKPSLSFFNDMISMIANEQSGT